MEGSRPTSHLHRYSSSHRTLWAQSPSPWQPRRYTCCYLQALTSQSHHCHYVSVLTKTEELREDEEVQSERIRTRVVYLFIPVSRCTMFPDMLKPLILRCVFVVGHVCLCARPDSLRRLHYNEMETCLW